MSDEDILAALKNAHLATSNIVGVKTVLADPTELKPVQGTPGQAEAEKAAHERGRKELEEHLKQIADDEAKAAGANPANAKSPIPPCAS